MSDDFDVADEGTYEEGWNDAEVEFNEKLLAIKTEWDDALHAVLPVYLWNNVRPELVAEYIKKLQESNRDR